MPDVELAGKRRWVGLAVLALSLGLVVLDGTIVGVSLPVIIADLKLSLTDGVWVNSLYSVVFAALLLTAGRLGDRMGRRRLLIAGILAFVLGSVLAALSTGAAALIAARAVQGVGGALILPSTLSTVNATFRGKDRAVAFGVWGAVMSGAAALGPLLGGLLTTYASWHWIFWVNVPVGLVGLVAARRYMRSSDVQGVRGFDSVGYGLLAFGMAAVSLAVEAMAGGGVRGASALVLLVFGLASLAAYALHALRSKNPLFVPALFGVRTLRVGLLGNFFSRLGSSAMPFMIPLVLQVSLGYTALQAGMMMLPAVLGSMAVKPLVTRMVRRFGYREVLVANTCALALLIISFAAVAPGQPLALMVAQLALFGGFNSMQFSAMNTVTLKDLEPGHASSGNSLLSMVQMLAMGMGVALAGAVLASMQSYFGASQGAGGTLDAFRVAFACMGLLTLAATALFLQLPAHEVPRPHAPGPEEQG